MNESKSEIEKNKIDEIISKIKFVQEGWGKGQRSRYNSVVIELFEKNILKVKNPELSTWFAKNIKGADIKAHGQVILESKDPEYNCYFAEKVKGSDILAHRNVVIKSYHIFWICQLDEYMDEEDVRCFNEINNKILSLSPSDK